MTYITVLTSILFIGIIVAVGYGSYMKYNNYTDYENEMVGKEVKNARSERYYLIQPRYVWVRENN